VVIVQQISPGFRARHPRAVTTRRAKSVLAMRERQLRRELAKPSRLMWVPIPSGGESC
jgi:hypothetical protein